MDGLNLVHLWSDLSSSKPVPQVLHLLLGPLTLGWIQRQACLLDLAQDSLLMMPVLLQGKQGSHFASGPVAS